MARVARGTGGPAGPHRPRRHRGCGARARARRHQHEGGGGPPRRQRGGPLPPRAATGGSCSYWPPSTRISRVPAPRGLRPALGRVAAGMGASRVLVLRRGARGPVAVPDRCAPVGIHGVRRRLRDSGARPGRFRPARRDGRLQHGCPLRGRGRGPRAAGPGSGGGGTFDDGRAPPDGRHAASRGARRRAGTAGRPPYQCGNALRRPAQHGARRDRSAAGGGLGARSWIGPHPVHRPRSPAHPLPRWRERSPPDPGPPAGTRRGVRLSGARCAR